MSKPSYQWLMDTLWEVARTGGQPKPQATRQTPPPLSRQSGQAQQAGATRLFAKPKEQPGPQEARFADNPRLGPPPEDP